MQVGHGPVQTLCTARAQHAKRPPEGSTVLARDSGSGERTASGQTAEELVLPVHEGYSFKVAKGCVGRVSGCRDETEKFGSDSGANRAISHFTGHVRVWQPHNFTLGPRGPQLKTSIVQRR